MSASEDRSVTPVTLVPVSVGGDHSDVQPVEAACIALAVVSEYATLTGTSKTSPVRELVVDLVADLMHLCAQSGFSFEAIVGEASALVESDCDDLFSDQPHAS